MPRAGIVFCLMISLALCARAHSPAAAGHGACRGQPNIVMIVADDMGVDLLGAYGEGARPPCTPRIDQLANEGVLFRNAWSNPTCTPTRAQLLSGQYGFRTGIGRTVTPSGETLRGLSETIPILPRVLEGYDSSAIGKWHLAPGTNNADHPLRVGFKYYAGSLFNLGVSGAGERSYWDWTKTINGHSAHRTVYATIDTADDAIARAAAMQPPWFLYVAFDAPHLPAHRPPESLCPTTGKCQQQYLPLGQKAGTASKVKAAVEALDTETGRIIDAVRAIDPAAVIIFLGDNGTVRDATERPFIPAHAKGSLYEGGINVPLIVSVPGGAVGECDALVSTADLFATLTELAGMGARTEDSVSLVPYLYGMTSTSLRQTVYAEKFRPNFDPTAETYHSRRRAHERAVRNERYKLIRRSGTRGARHRDEFFDLLKDPFELRNLMPPEDGEQRDNYKALVQRLVELGVN